MKSKDIEKYEIMKLKYAEDTRAHGKQLRQLQFRRTRLGCPRRSFRSRRRPPEAAWATIARVAGPRRPRVGRPRFEHRRPDADATAADDVLHFGGVLWSQVEHAAAASGMSRLHRGTERAADFTAGVDEAGVVIEEIAAVVAAGACCRCCCRRSCRCCRCLLPEQWPPLPQCADVLGSGLGQGDDVQVAGVILGGTLALALPSSPKGSGRNVNSS